MRLRDTMRLFKRAETSSLCIPFKEDAEVGMQMMNALGTKAKEISRTMLVGAQYMNRWASICCYIYTVIDKRTWNKVLQAPHQLLS